MLGAVSGVITIGEAGIAFAISLPLGVDRFNQVKPNYIELNGWSEKTMGAKKLSDSRNCI